MDETRFQEAKQAYDAGDYRAAAKGFLAAAGRGTDGNGVAYHMAGNALMRLRRYADAVTVYGHALRDDLYDKRGPALANLAAAYAAQGDYAEAVVRYREALEDPGYDSHYRALQGMAGALLEMGRIEDAASAYRQAALDSDNPDSGKALNNLGLCFMSLGRATDAVEAYKAALGFDAYEGRGKALANLGIAFCALGEHAEAVRAFEKSVQLHGHELTGHALRALEDSRDALSTAEPSREVVEGWQTGETPPLDAVPGLSDAMFVGDVGTTHPPVPTVTGGVPTAQGDTGVLFGEGELESAFFTRTEQDMKDADRELRRRERQLRRDERSPWRTTTTVAAAVIVVLGTLAALYFSGYGFPTQTMTVESMLSARAQGDPVDGFWVAVPNEDVDKEMAKIPPIKEYLVEGVERAARTSRVKVTVTPENGVPLSYEISLSREGAGWKVSGVANDWRPTGDVP